MDLANENFLMEVENLKKRTPWEEEVIGCFLCNYGDHRICGSFQSSGCKHTPKCRGLNRIRERMRN